MRNLYKYLPLVLLIFLGCGEDEKVKQLSNKEYFPLQKGFYQIYGVQGAVYTELEDPQPFSYELKTEVVDSFANSEGGYTYTIHRSRRDTEADPWEFQEVWSARVTPYRAISVEGNVSFIRISFPAVLNKEWNGNALNTQIHDDYVVEGTGPYTLDTGTTFDDCIRIIQEDESNLLFRDQREEVYARNIGLIYKKSIIVNYCDEVDCFGQEIVDDGVVYEQVLKSYGQN